MKKIDRLIHEASTCSPKLTDEKVTADVTNDCGCGQTGAGPHVIFDVHPGAFVAAPLLNLKVKQPSAVVEVNEPGLVVPQKDPATPPGTVPAGFPLEIKAGAETAFQHLF